MLNFRHYILVIAALGVCTPALAQEASTSSPPRPISAPINDCLALTYPSAALKEEAEGTTHVSITVLPSGAVTDVAVSKASGLSKAHQVLDKAAVKATSRCVYAEALGFSARTGIIKIVWKLEPAATNDRNDHHDSRPPSERESSGT